MRWGIWLFFAACFVPANLWASPPGAIPYELQILPVGGKPPVTITAWEMGGAVFLPADRLAQVLDGTYAWRSDLGRLTLTIGSHTMAVTDQSEIAVIDGDAVIALPGRAFLWESRILVPLALVVDDAGNAREWIEAPLKFVAEQHLLKAATQRQANLTDVGVIQDALGWKLSLTADHPFKTRLIRTERASIVLRLQGVSYDPMYVVFPTEHPWFQGLRLRSVPSGVEVLFSAGILPRGYGLIRSHDKKTVEILLGVDERDIRTGRLTPFASPSGGGHMQLRRLVLDPGHDADREGGAAAYALCLELARTVSEGLGIEALVTHPQDQDPPPEVRVRRANEAGGDLFISLHVHQRPGGPTAYVGQPSGPVDLGRGLSRLGFRPYYSIKETDAQISRAVAQDLVQAVSDRLGVPPGGVFTESLPELQGSLMPAVLVEFGREAFSWTEEERGQVVEGLATAIRNQYWRSGP